MKKILKIFLTLLLMFFILTPIQVFASETGETNKSRLLTNSSTIVQGVDVINAQQSVITPIRNKVLKISVRIEHLKRLR